MSVQAIVEKDFRDGMRSRLLWVLTSLFVLLLGGIALAVTRGGQPETQQEATAILELFRGSVFIAVVLLVPLTGLVVSMKSIARERELGSIKVLLSLPHERWEVLLGKFLGRSALLTTAIVAGFLPAGIIYVVRIDGFPVGQYVVFTIATVLLGLQFVAIGVAASALLESESQATLAGVGLLFLLLTWRFFFEAGNLITGALSGNDLFFLRRFYLLTLFNDMVRGLLSLTEELSTNATAAIGPRDVEPVIQNGSPVIPDQPFYLQHWFAFVILAALIVVPLAIGYYRFDRMDL